MLNEGSSHTDRNFVVEPFSANCRAIYRKGAHVVMGVSPGNSYFRVDLLGRLLRWLRAHFQQIDVVIPDTALVATYLAMGYSSQKSAKKSHAEISVLHNRVHRGWEAAGGPRPADGLHMMSALEARPAYQRALRTAEDALAADPGLRATALGMSRTFLSSRLRGSETDCVQTELGTRYLLAELPFLLASADIFEVNSSLCFYHQPVPLAEALFTRGSPLRAPSSQAYAIIRPASATA